MNLEKQRSQSLQALFDRVAAIRGTNIATLTHWPTLREKWDEPMLERQIDWVKRAGFNTVKLAINWNPFLGSAPDYIIFKAFLDVVEHAVDAARARGLLVIIDHHRATFASDDPETSLDRVCAVWQQLGARFAHIPDDELWFQPVADYTENVYQIISAKMLKIDTDAAVNASTVQYAALTDATRMAHTELILSGGLNEAARMLYPEDGRIGETIGAYRALFPRVLEIIREKNPKRPVLLRNLTKAHSCLSPWITCPEDDDALIEFFHVYHPVTFCLQGTVMFAPTSGGLKKYPVGWGIHWRSSDVDRRAIRSVIRASLVRGERRERPVIIAEFGCSRHAPTRDRMRHIACVRSEAEDAGLGWIYWEPFESLGFANARTQRVWDPGALAALLPSSALLPHHRAMPAIITATSILTFMSSALRRTKSSIFPR